MAIQVTCPKCLTRFTVGDQHAGKTGACPKCKGQIKVPEKSEEVVIHAPEHSEGGAKDASGRSTLKPLKRKETKFQLNAALLIGGGVLLSFGLAFLAGHANLSASALRWVKILGAVALGPALALAGYTFLRSDEELEPYRGLQLLGRCAGCGLAFAAAWGVYWYVGYQVFGAEEFSQGKLEMLHISILIAIAAGIGTLASFVSFDFEPLVGFFHFALYFLATVLLRLAMGATLLPGMGGGT
jgi:hypothetical protein